MLLEPGGGAYKSKCTQAEFESMNRNVLDEYQWWGMHFTQKVVFVKSIGAMA